MIYLSMEHPARTPRANPRHEGGIFMPTTTTEVVVAAPRYAPNTEELSARILAARDRVGRPTLAKFLGISESACYRAERNKIHPSELAALQAAKLEDLKSDKPRSVRGQVADLLATVTAETDPVDLARQISAILA
jgi:DNA-binding XRE family transcriptional regulator